jgi:PTH1 family peptidyl-tRNA hydrolase
MFHAVNMDHTAMQSLFERLRPRRDAEPTTGEVALIVGLGNPGREYAQTRHNIGFQVVSRLADKHGLNFSRVQNQAIIATGRVGGARVVLAKPQTWMNDSGQAVGPLVRFYKVELTRLLIVYDDLDRPSGSLRLRSEGGHGGHNGMRSIVTRLGTQEFARLRVGIGRPPGRMDPAAYVLQPFARDEEILMDAARDRAVEAIECFLAEGIVSAMNKYNANVDD